MTVRTHRQSIVTGVVAAILFATACAPASRDMTSARTGFKDYVAQCTARYGYSPEEGSTLGPYVLGANEREWRECVYQGIEQYLTPSSLTPEIYRQAIAEDRKLTDNVSAGKMTRAQRAARLQELISNIDRIEEANKAKIEQMQSAERLVKEEMARQQDPMRRVLMVPLAR
jgi:hypothetical protein